jgi:protein-disulfide isomerase
MKTAICAIVAITVLGLLFSPTLSIVNAEDILSPRKQMESGIAAENVMCKSELVLMIRSTNGAAACVKSTTSVKLSDAGWGSITEQADMEDKVDETMEDGIEEGAVNATEVDTHNKEILLEEGLSMDISNESSQETAEAEPFTIGGIDLSMAAPVEGQADAPVTIIEFGDYQCPKCQDWFHNEKPSINSKYIVNGIVNLYFVDFAWEGEHSVLAAQATYCANDQGKFQEYHSALYNNQGGIQDGWADADSLKQFAVDLGLDSEKFNECLESGTYADRISYNTEVGTSHGVQATPYFFIVGPEGEIKKIVGPQPSIVFEAALNSLGY